MIQAPSPKEFIKETFPHMRSSFFYRIVNMHEGTMGEYMSDFKHVQQGSFEELYKERGYTKFKVKWFLDSATGSCSAMRSTMRTSSSLSFGSSSRG